MARVSAPFISPLALYWFIILAYLSHYSSGKLFCSAFLLPTRLRVYGVRICVYLCVSGGSVHLRGIELVTADFKKINHSQV